VVAVPHEKIVNLLATSVGEVIKQYLIAITIVKASFFYQYFILLNT